MPLVTIGHVIAGCGRFAYVFGTDFATLVVDHLLRHRLRCRIAAAVSAGIATAALIICNQGIAQHRTKEGGGDAPAAVAELVAEHATGDRPEHTPTVAALTTPVIPALNIPANGQPT